MKDLKAIQIQIENINGDSLDTKNGVVYMEEKLFDKLLADHTKRTILLNGSIYIKDTLI